MPSMHEVILPESFFEPSKPAAISADDRLEILEVVSRFEWCFDARRFDALSGLLTDDVVIDHLFGYRSGKKAVVNLLRDVVTSTGLRHQATNAVIYLQDDGQIAVASYLFVIQVVDELSNGVPAPAILGHGLVTDVMRKEDGHWKIARRTFEQMKVPAWFLADATARVVLEQTANERAARSNGHI